MADSQKTFLIMKLFAVSLIAGVLAILYFHSNLHEELFTQNRAGIPDLGPVTARPEAAIFEFKDNTSGPDEVTRSLADYRGQIVHLNFWAEWCEPCARELPMLEKLQSEYHEKYGDLYKIILINVDTDEASQAKAKTLQTTLAPSLTSIYQGTQAIKEKMNATALPYHILIDKNGNTALAFYTALDKYEEKFKQVLRQLLDEALQPAKTAAE